MTDLPVNKIEYKTVTCSECGYEQEEDIDNSSFVCEECGAIFFDSSDD